MRCLILVALICSTASAQAWQRHTIDSSLQGADGVRLADLNGDGQMDIVTGWEESGIVRLYLHPGKDFAKKPWPAVTVGKAKSPEDAVAFDIDGDGQLEIISCHEGNQKQVLVHRNTAGSSTAELLRDDHWRTNRFAALDGQRWMYAQTIRLRDSSHAIVLGSKGTNGSLTLLLPPENTKQPLRDWRPIKLRTAAWIMSIETVDMDQDGDTDIVFNDRKGQQRGIYWLQQPDDSPDATWAEHAIGARDHETLFIHVTTEQILASTRNHAWLELRHKAHDDWTTIKHPNPDQVPFGKAIMPLGEDSYLMTANTSADKIPTPQPGIWIKQAQRPWQAIGTTAATKFDRMELIDLDDDGDLDVLTCEERQNLGVIWYENPGLIR